MEIRQPAFAASFKRSGLMSCRSGYESISIALSSSAAVSNTRRQLARLPGLNTQTERVLVEYPHGSPATAQEHKGRRTKRMPLIDMLEETLSGCFDFAQSAQTRRCPASRLHPEKSNQPASQSSPPTLQNSFLCASFVFRCIARRNQVHKKTGHARVTSTDGP